MDENMVLQALGQARSEEVGEIWQTFLRGAVRDMICGVMAEEVQMLCGPRHQPEEGADCYRSGTAPGYVLHEGKRQDIQRPRVRKRTASGSQEVRLQSYESAKDPVVLKQNILNAFLCGVSSRDQKRLQGKRTPGTSPSEVSRLWIQEGSKLLEEFRSRDIERKDWLVLMLDGIRLANELHAVVALGVAADGTKKLLDFAIGSSENTEVVTDLLTRLRERRFQVALGCRLLAVLDGSHPLKQGILKHWPDAHIQRCLVHKKQNLQRYLPMKHWGELKRLFDRLRKAQGREAGEAAKAALESFLQGKNKAAADSLAEAGEELTAFHRLNVPATLNPSFLSTNLIENPFRNTRNKIRRVTKWNEATNQPARWMAYALTEAEKGFRRVRNYRDMPALQEALRKSREEVPHGPGGLEPPGTLTRKAG